MPAVAVIGQTLRSTNNGHVASNGHTQCEASAWQVPESERKQRQANGTVKKAAGGGVGGGETHLSRQMSAYRRWMTKNNRVGHSNRLPPFGPNIRMVNRLADIVVSESSRFRAGQKYQETPSAAVVLYMGIGMFLVGLVITFVGLGENGFQTLELQLIGPCLTGLGLIVCGIRVLVCCCASRCSYCDRVIQKEETTQTKSPSSSERSLPDSRKVPSVAARFVPPSTSSRHFDVVERGHSWDTPSLDMDMSPDCSSKADKTRLHSSSSILSPDPSEDDDDVNKANCEFQEIELRRVATPKPLSRMGSYPTQDLLPVDSSQFNHNPNRKGESLENASAEKTNISSGLVLDPQMYLNRATLAALNSNAIITNTGNSNNNNNK